MELELVYNEETQEWEEKPEPFITIECETEEDFEFIGTAVAFYKKHLEEKPQTNADRIRAMSDEELANWVAKTQIANVAVALKIAHIPWEQHPDLQELTAKDCLEWLKQPAYEPPTEESQQSCTYNKDGHCIGQKLMPECDPQSCDRWTT